uniref:Pectinesterase inhibitor 10-like n=1 Tax=Elaeis guineensis var. tenera TaxID=51953 RepID=A0A6I9QN73_ELAGV|nr:pectinesterase inhibitor 10-like [Elaeis guineensis]
MTIGRQAESGRTATPMMLLVHRWTNNRMPETCNPRFSAATTNDKNATIRDLIVSPDPTSALLLFTCEMLPLSPPRPDALTSPSPSASLPAFPPSTPPANSTPSSSASASLLMSALSPPSSMPMSRPPTYSPPIRSSLKCPSMTSPPGMPSS